MRKTIVFGFKMEGVCMISKWVCPMESWGMVWNSEEVIAGQGNFMGVNKSTPEGEMEENQG